MCQSYVLDGPNLVKGVPVDALAPGPAEGRGRAAVVEADHDIPLLGEHQVPENKVRVDMGIFEAVARGFLRSARGITPREVELIVDAVRIIALELGVRFLSDYLRGDSYFKLGAADPPDLNKTRAVAQLTLFERLGEQADAARRCIATLRIRGWQSGNGGVMRELKIGTSWVRGVVGDALTPELIVNFSCAFGTWGNGGPVVIGRDTRRSSPALRAAVISGLLSTGCEVIDLGVCPSPMLSFAVRELGTEGGISITGGHNNARWNALKFIGADGALLNTVKSEELLEQ